MFFLMIWAQSVFDVCSLINCVSQVEGANSEDMKRDTTFIIKKNLPDRAVTHIPKLSPEPASGLSRSVVMCSLTVGFHSVLSPDSNILLQIMLPLV